MMDLGKQPRKHAVSKRSIEFTGLAMHSAASPDWGTPMLLRRFAAAVLRPAAKLGGAIDLDYATSAYWQAWWPDPKDRPSAFLDGSEGRDVRVAADRRRAAPRLGSGFFNPPGLGGGSMAQTCWGLFEEDHRTRQLDAGVWVGFSLEQLTSFQGVCERNPLTTGAADLITTIVPSRRARYILHPEALIAILQKKLAKREKGSLVWLAEQRKIEALKKRADDAPVPGDAPTHASYVTLLLSRNKTVRRRQCAAATAFLKSQKADPKSLLHRFEIIGSLEAR